MIYMVVHRLHGKGGMSLQMKYIISQKAKIQYNTEPPRDQEDKKHCPVMEQKEEGILKRDESCGKDSKEGMAGLCE